MSQMEAGVGLAIFDYRTGLCTGVISQEGNAGVHGIETPLFEPMAMHELGEVFDQHHPRRRITRFGPTIGRMFDQDIPEWIQMADGTRYRFAGSSARGGDIFHEIQPGQLALLPGFLFEAMAAENASYSSREANLK